MSPASPSRRQLASSTLSVRMGQALRRYFLTGLATLFPVAVTIWLVVTIFNFADGFLGNWLGSKIPGLGLLLTLLVILLVGVLSVHFFGRVLFGVVDIALSRLPITRTIYPAAKQFAQFLFEDKTQQTTIRGVVLVQYPRLGVYSMAFVTNETEAAINGGSQTLLTVLLPNPPSPFTGPIVCVPKREVIPLDLAVEDAV